MLTRQLLYKQHCRGHTLVASLLPQNLIQHCFRLHVTLQSTLETAPGLQSFNVVSMPLLSIHNGYVSRWTINFDAFLDQKCSATNHCYLTSNYNFDGLRHKAKYGREKLYMYVGYVPLTIVNDSNESKSSAKSGGNPPQILHTLLFLLSYYMYTTGDHTFFKCMYTLTIFGCLLTIFRKKVGEIIKHVSSVNLLGQYAKACEADGHFLKAAQAYETACDYDNAIRYMYRIFIV